jgi:hypothetical protein
MREEEVGRGVPAVRPLCHVEAKTMRASWVVAGICLLVAIAAVAYAAGKTSASEVVRAQKFELVDARGEARASLGVDSDGPAFELTDDGGRPRARLFVDADGVGLMLLDEKGAMRAGLGVGPEGPALGLLDGKETARASIGVESDGPAVTLWDADRTPRVALASTSDNPFLALLHKQGNGITISPEMGVVEQDVVERVNE